MAEGRGGRRVGTPGKAYSNRTDLNVVRAPTQLPQVAPAAGQPYGAQAEQIRSLQAVPSQTPAPVAPTGPPATPPQPAAEPLPFARPTERPDEPVTAGLGVAGQAPRVDLGKLRRWMPALERIAQQPDTSDETIELVRYWRSLL